METVDGVDLFFESLFFESSLLVFLGLGGSLLENKETGVLIRVDFLRGSPILEGGGSLEEESFSLGGLLDLL